MDTQKQIVEYLKNPKRCKEIFEHILLLSLAFQIGMNKKIWFKMWFVHEIEEQKYLLN